MTTLNHNSTPAEVAAAMLDFYAGDPNRWTQGAFCRDASGDSTNDNSKATCWCAVGCLYQLTNRVDGDREVLKLQNELISVLESTLGIESLVDWNDGRGSFKDFTICLQSIVDANP